MTGEEMSAWRENRERGWQRDVGYALQDVLRSHVYQDWKHRARVGWHACTCGWEGYWPDFHPHVADHLRRVVVPVEEKA